MALAGPWLLCPAAPHPSAPCREALSGPAVRGLAAERGPAARPGSWPGSTVPRCWQHPAEAGSHAEVHGGSWPGRGGVAGLAPRTGSPGAAPLTPAMGCESRGRHGQLICLCQEPARETVPPKRGGDSSSERVLDTTPLPSSAQDRAATRGWAPRWCSRCQHQAPAAWGSNPCTTGTEMGGVKPSEGQCRTPLTGTTAPQPPCGAQVPWQPLRDSRHHPSPP